MAVLPMGGLLQEGEVVEEEEPLPQPVRWVVRLRMMVLNR